MLTVCSKEFKQGLIMVHELKINGIRQISLQKSQASSPCLFLERKETKGFIAPSNATQWFRAVRNPSSNGNCRRN